MGVRGLLSTCLRNQRECADIVDLVEEAKKKSGIEILCDFYSFEHLILGNFWKSLIKVARNDFLPILGGEYKVLDHYVNKLVTDLKALDIHLVLIIDASKGSSRRGTEAKIDTWNRRHYQDMEKLQKLLDVCNGHRNMKDLPSDVAVRPVLLEVQFRQTLKECGCEMIQCAWGEADFIIAKSLQEREKAFAILSNDSDFCIFRQCTFIPNELFDLQNDLKLGGDQPYPEKPLRLECGVISSTKVTSFLGFPDESHLVELSIIAGNDFTGPHLPRHLLAKMGFKNHVSLNDFAVWVKKHKHVEDEPQFFQEMQKNRKLDDAVHTSRQFYSVSFPPEESNVKGELSRYLQEGIEQGRYPAAIMGMHQNFYWYRMLLEDVSEGAPSIELALAPLRSYIYRILLDRKDNMVIEHGRNPYEVLRASPVYVNREKGIPTANFMNHDKIFPSLRMFARIMRHQEPEFPINFFDRYGWRNGFSYFCLRYMLRLNTDAYLHITLEEFLVLFATVFCLVDESWYQGLSLVPTSRCVTIGNWFQDIYRHAFCFLGKLFHLTHEFPLPKDLFSGSVYTAFYMIRIHQGMLMRHGFPPDWSHRINREYKKIIDEKRHILRYVLEGIHTMHDRQC